MDGTGDKKRKREPNEQMELEELDEKRPKDEEPAEPVLSDIYYGPSTSSGNPGSQYSAPKEVVAPEESQESGLQQAEASNCWQIFLRQTDAVSFVRKFPTVDLLVFAFDNSPSDFASRSYLVCSPYTLWETIWNKDPVKIHYSEVITEDSPCKLYLDVQFGKNLNYLKDGVPMTITLIKVFILALKEMLNVELGFSDVMWLDSSNERRYSCRLVFQIPNMAFTDNMAVGRLVNTITLKILTCISVKVIPPTWPSYEEMEKMMVIGKNSIHVFCCDLGVYTRNRNLRTYWSAKRGQENSLLRSIHNQYRPGCSAEEDFKRNFFLDSLVTFFRTKTQDFNVVNYRSSGETLTSTGDDSSGVSSSSSLNEGSGCPQNSSSGVDNQRSRERETLQLPGDDSSGVSSSSSLNEGSGCPQNSSSGVDNQRSRERETLQLPGHTLLPVVSSTHLAWQWALPFNISEKNGSPFPDVDRYIEIVIKGQIPPASVREVTFLQKAQQIVYALSGRKFYCNRGQRYHKSDNIRYVVDVGSGTFSQDCSDPKCADVYYSPSAKGVEGYHDLGHLLWTDVCLITVKMT